MGSIVGVVFGDVDFVPNRQGMMRVLKSGEVAGIVGDTAARIAANATMMADEKPRGYYGKQSPKYGSRTKIQRTAAHGYAYTGNYAAMYDNAANDTLHRAI